MHKSNQIFRSIVNFQIAGISSSQSNNFSRILIPDDQIENLENSTDSLVRLPLPPPPSPFTSRSTGSSQLDKENIAPEPTRPSSPTPRPLPPLPPPPASVKTTSENFDYRSFLTIPISGCPLQTNRADQTAHFKLPSSLRSPFTELSPGSKLTRFKHGRKVVDHRQQVKISGKWLVNFLFYCNFFVR
ncbi:hypothetical protein FBUS_01959 [Fasciolopsis buskii]|uniref:Uncharacterized protein n=1 Tax=Fasciolopsis buskii TaxID=27845 RepID=A0A8E0RTF9_9TREM|nr:hypothetical protein FBUS_01959 [Fasciolopsis buski]